MSGILIVSFIRLGFWYTSSASWHIVLDNKNNRDWEEAVDFIEEREKSTDAIIFYSYYIKYPFVYYFYRESEVLKSQPIEIAPAYYPIGGGTELPEPNFALLEHLPERYSRVWLILSYNDLSTLSRKKQAHEVEAELNKYYKVAEDIHIDEIEVKLFEKR